jgi:hypothetical protein
MTNCVCVIVCAFGVCVLFFVYLRLSSFVCTNVRIYMCVPVYVFLSVCAQLNVSHCACLCDAETRTLGNVRQDEK